jgi:hypothetical protein
MIGDMSTRRKLVTFVVILLVAFLAGITLGAVLRSEPDDPVEPPGSSVVETHSESHE